MHHARIVAASAGVCLGMGLASWAVGQTITRNITGSYYGSTGSGFAFTPPDTNGAVGPGHFVELLNGVYAIYDKGTGANVSRVSDTQFWIDAFNNAGTPFNPGTDITDPRVLYDPLSRRWFGVEVTTVSPGYQIMVARSNSSDPTSGFKAVKFASTSALFPDYPTLGLDANGVYIGSNNFPDFIGSVTVSLWSLPKADLLLGTPSVANRTAFTQKSIGTYGWTLQPIFDTAPAKTRAPVLAISSSSPSNTTSLKRSTIYNSAGGATLSASGTSIPVSAYSVPPDAQQPGSIRRLDSIDGRFQSTVCQVGNDIWAVHAISSGGRAALRWYRIDETFNTVVQQGTIADASFDYTHPSIAANANGDVVIGFTRSGATAPAGYAGAYAFVGSTSGGVTTFGSILTLHGGEQTYTLDGNTTQRWGDYSSTTTDPADPGLFWTIQEYARAGNTWGEQISEITPAVANEFRWKDAASDNFTTASAWLPGSIPVAAGHAIFSRLTNGAPYVVTINSNQTNSRLSVRQGDVDFLNSATYTLTNAATGTPSVVIGEFGGSPNVNLRGSGTIASVNAMLAPNAISTASVTLRDSQTWNNSGALYLAGTGTAAGGSGTITLAAGASPTLTVGGTLKVWTGGTVYYNSGALSAGTIDMSGGRLLLSAGGDKVLRANWISATGTGKIDLADNNLIVDYTAVSLAGVIRGLLVNGRNGGAWTGNGITSSSAAADTATALGIGEASVLGISSFDGATVDATTVLVKYTWYGDANLDGQVDISDLGALATGWQTGGVWTSGDFDYSGFVDISDLGLLATNWQAGVGSPLGPGFDDALAGVGLSDVRVPEPATLPGLFLPLAAAASRTQRLAVICKGRAVARCRCSSMQNAQHGINRGGKNQSTPTVQCVLELNWICKMNRNES